MVLFDEVDKAHPDTLTIMLQLFDEVNFFNPQIFDSSTKKNFFFGECFRKFLVSLDKSGNIELKNFFNQFKGVQIIFKFNLREDLQMEKERL